MASTLEVAVGIPADLAVVPVDQGHLTGIAMVVMAAGVATVVPAALGELAVLLVVPAAAE
jgi:hypothetical protein